MNRVKRTFRLPTIRNFHLLGHMVQIVDAFRNFRVEVASPPVEEALISVERTELEQTAEI